MSERIDQFCENLRNKLTSVDDNMQGLKDKIASKAHTAEHEARAQLDTVNKRIEHDRAKVTAAQGDVRKWMEERKASSAEKIADWKAKREQTKLRSRADHAEWYAEAAAIVLRWPPWMRPSRLHSNHGWRATTPISGVVRDPCERLRHSALGECRPPTVGIPA